jgi:hypothetical protein
MLRYDKMTNPPTGQGVMWLAFPQYGMQGWSGCLDKG